MNIIYRRGYFYMNKANYQSSKKLVMFFVITLAWTWICGFIPVIFGLTGTKLGTFIFFFGGGAPSVVALLFVFITYPKEVQKDYFYRCFSLKKMGWKWPLLTILFFTIIIIIGFLISTKIFSNKGPEMNWLKTAVKAPYKIPVMLFLSFISGPLNEEFGWRGYALDKLLVRFGFFGASMLLGFIWGIWHLAWYFTPGQTQYNLLQNSLVKAILYIPGIMLLSIVVTFVYINTNRSIMAGAFVHMMGNFITSQLISPYSVEFETLIRIIQMLFCILVTIYCILSSKFKNKVKNQLEIIKAT